MTTVPCPHCQGGKTTYGIVCPGGDIRQMPCSTCKGEGVITTQHLDYVHRGSAMRLERVSKYESQAEAARRMGIDRVLLSRLENGHVDAWTEWIEKIST